jgi:hypothetical protein
VGSNLVGGGGRGGEKEEEEGRRRRRMGGEFFDVWVLEFLVFSLKNLKLSSLDSFEDGEGK